MDLLEPQEAVAKPGSALARVTTMFLDSNFATTLTSSSASAPWVRRLVQRFLQLVLLTIELNRKGGGPKRELSLTYYITINTTVPH